MAHAYTPGLKVSEKAVIRKERKLPLWGDVLVNKGDRVKAEDVVARALLPGPVHPKNLAGELGIPHSRVKKCPNCKERGKHNEGSGYS
jgi:hypothetical protein